MSRKKILVVDVAAQHSGGAAILKEFFQYVCRYGLVREKNAINISYIMGLKKKIYIGIPLLLFMKNRY